MSRFGLAVRRLKFGKQKKIGWILLGLSFLFKSCDLWTLSCDFVLHDYSDIKMALVVVQLNAEIILVVTV